MSNDQEQDLFTQEMAGVRRLTPRVERVELKPTNVDQDTLAARRQAAVTLPSADDNPLVSEGAQLLDPFYILDFKRPGVQNGVYRKLRLGRYEQEARLDLHGMTLEKARREVFAFLKEALSLDLRSVVIVHGKGGYRREDTSLLKSYLHLWLPMIDEVQAYHSAQPQHGGTGAVYVLLRKSERKKEENRNRFRGRGQ